MEQLAKSRGLRFLTNTNDLDHWGRDWTHYFPVNALGVIFPKTVADVSEILKHCHTHRICVVPSGGRTGLVGGAYATQGELILSLSQMNRILDWDPLGLTVKVEAGVIHETLQDYLRPKGFHWPVDLAAKGSCQIGGNLATNAGGVRVIKYGMTRRWVQSLTVVMANGKILELNGDLEKNNTGPCLRDLVIGSEGTLAVIAEARLKVTHLPRQCLTLFAPVENPAAALTLLQSLRECGAPLLAFEFIDKASLDLVLKHCGDPNPFGEFMSDAVLIDLETTDVSDVYAKTALDPRTILGESHSQVQKFWHYREIITEALDSMGFVYKHDVSLPQREIPRFLKTVDQEFSRRFPGATNFVFGHFGDGNLHLNFGYSAKDPDGRRLAHCEAANDWLFNLVHQYRGAISAEHGIGLLKRAYLRFTKSPEELAILHALKKAMDPHAILNPGKGVV